MTMALEREPFAFEFARFKELSNDELFAVDGGLSGGQTAALVFAGCIFIAVGGCFIIGGLAIATASSGALAAASLGVAGAGVTGAGAGVIAWNVAGIFN